MTLDNQLLCNRYLLIRRINSGGMGEIFEAVDTQRSNHRVAVKVLHQRVLARDEIRSQLLNRFKIEAQINMLLSNHPNITKVLDYGWDPEQPFIVMEFLGDPPLIGSNLSDLIERTGPMDPTRMVRLAQQMCAGFHYAHSFEHKLDDYTIKGVLHRDIKPSNIFVIQDPLLDESSELVKILDFGIAKIVSDINVTLGTQLLGILGTLQYASPEQLRGEVLDYRSDIYSLGIILYEMLTGQLPLNPKTDSHWSWIEAHMHQAPIHFQSLTLPHSLPVALQALVMSCLEKDPDQRPESMQALGYQLKAALGQASTQFRGIQPVLTTPTEPINLAQPHSTQPTQDLTVDQHSPTTPLPRITMPGFKSQLDSSTTSLSEPARHSSITQDLGTPQKPDTTIPLSQKSKALRSALGQSQVLFLAIAGLLLLPVSLWISVYLFNQSQPSTTPDLPSSTPSPQVISTSTESTPVPTSTPTPTSVAILDPTPTPTSTPTSTPTPTPTKTPKPP